MPIERYSLPAPLLQAAINILASLPYHQVAEVMDAVKQACREQENPPAPLPALDDIIEKKP